jgi:hypothetical protein
VIKRERVAYALFAVGSLITLGFMVYAGRPSSLGWFVGIAPFAIWVMAPFAGGAVVCRAVRSSPRSLAIVSVAAGLLACGTAVLLYHGLVVAPDAQGGLLFLFLPLWQALALTPFVVIALRVARREAAAHHL